MNQGYRGLAAWQRSMELTQTIYELTGSFPPSERFALSDQLRRAAISVPSNIAEGYGRATRGEYVQFLGHARGSAFEIETQLLLACSLGYGEPSLMTAAQKRCAEVGRLLSGLMASLRRTSRSEPAGASRGGQTDQTR